MTNFKHIRRAARQPFETAGFMLLKWGIPLLPRCAIVGLANLAGRIAWWLPLRGKQFGLKNIEAVFGDTKTAAEKRFILISSLSTFCQTMLDVIWFSRNPEKRIAAYTHFSTTPETASFFEEKPAMCITAHMGSWEIMGQAAALLGVDIASIAATVKNKTINRILIKQREQTGQTIIPRKGALRTLIALLRKNGTAGFVLDQNTSEKKGGIVVDFLGLPMPVSSAPAALAYRTGTDIMIGFCLPQPKGRYSLRMTHIIKPPPFDKERDMDQVVLELTQQIQDRISEEIRLHPEYWLWSYKHWRRTPGKTYPDNYPDY